MLQQAIAIPALTEQEQAIYATTLAVISIGVGISLMTLGDTTSSQCERSNRHIMEGVGK